MVDLAENEGTLVLDCLVAAETYEILTFRLFVVKNLQGIDDRCMIGDREVT